MCGLQVILVIRIKLNYHEKNERRYQDFQLKRSVIDIRR